jgi:hypothetical protein
MYSGLTMCTLTPSIVDGSTLTRMAAKKQVYFCHLHSPYWMNIFMYRGLAIDDVEG